MEINRTLKIKKTIVIVIFFIIAFTEACKAQKFLWPLPSDSGTIILRVGTIINPITGFEVFNDSYLIESTYNTPVLAVEDALVQYVIPYAIYNPDLLRLYSFPDKNYYLKKNNLIPENKDNWWFAENCITACLSLTLKNNKKINYSGLNPDNILVKPNQKVKKGDTLGFVGYFRALHKKPCFRIGLTGSNGVVEDIGIPLLNENNSLSFSKVKIKQIENLDTSTLKNAFQIFKNSLIDGHPALFHFSSKKILDSLFEGTEMQLNKPISRLKFRILLMQIISKIACSHTFVYFADNPEFKKDEFCFPIALSLCENDCLILDNLDKNVQIPIGSELLAIDNISIDSIVRNIQNLLPNDVRTDDVLKNLLIKPDYFNYYLKFGLHGIKDKHLIKIRRSDKVVQELTVASIPEKKLSQFKYNRIQVEKQRVSHYIIDTNIAYLSIQTCNFDSNEEKTISNFFDSLKSQNNLNLILDLRFNGGGPSDKFFASAFCKYIFKYKNTYKPKYKVNSNKTYSFLKYSNFHFEGEILFPEYTQSENEEGFWHEDNDSILQKNNEFLNYGKIYVLTNAYTQSCATIVSSILYNEGATIIGEETGGDYYSMSASDPVQIILPGVGIILNLPLIKFINFAQKDARIPPNRGLIPHYAVKRTKNSVLYGEDNQLKFAISVIRNEQH